MFQSPFNRRNPQHAILLQLTKLDSYVMSLSKMILALRQELKWEKSVKLKDMASYEAALAEWNFRYKRDHRADSVNEID